MKKPSRKLFLYQTRMTAYRVRAKKKGNQTEKLKNYSRRHSGSGSMRLLSLRAPDKFALTRGSGVQVVDFIQRIEERVLKQNRHARLDFRFTKWFFVPGALLLYAALNKIISVSQLKKPITIIPPRTGRAKQVMKQVGFFDLTSDILNVKTDRQDVIYWSLAKGATQSGDELKMLGTVAERANASNTARVHRSGLWRGVSEAVNNAHEHGYSKPRLDGFAGLPDTRWWLLTQIRDDKFTAAVCDLGCGYAQTLKPEVLEWFKSIVGQVTGRHNKDTFAIQAAMEYGRSSTKKDERGRGSRDALALLEKHENGELFILSNCGYLQYARSEGQTNLKHSVHLDFDIQGTIIWWNLQLGEIA